MATSPAASPRHLLGATSIARAVTVGLCAVTETATPLTRRLRRRLGRAVRRLQTAGDELRGDTLTPIQQGILAAGAVLGTAIAGVVALRAPAPAANWIKSGSALALFAAALAVPKRHPEQWLATAAFGASAIGDLFLTESIRIPGGLNTPAGIAAFTAAYGALIGAFWRGRVRPADLALAIPLVLTAAGMLAYVRPHLSAGMAIGLPVFTLVIGAMAWLALTLGRRGFFASDVSLWAAAGAAIIVASDTGVGLSLFIPGMADSVPLNMFIRLTYLAGWVLFLLFAADPNPRRQDA